ncbi:MAG TPA: TonB family protein [Blastocatellia bacterium]|nr:TonB family protein [Blastocatellia bacterium]
MRRTKPLSATPVAERNAPIAEPKTPVAEPKTPIAERRPSIPERPNPVPERKTTPTARPEPPGVEVVPLRNQPPAEPPAARPQRPMTPPAQQASRESAVPPLPFRKPEAQHPISEPPRRSAEEVPVPRRVTEDAPRRPQPIQEDVPRRPQPAQPVNRPAPTQAQSSVPAPRPTPRPAPARPMAQTPASQSFQAPRATYQSNAQPTLNFSVPDQGGLVSRLAAGLKNIGDVFKSGPAVRPGAAGDFKFLLPEEPLVKRIGREVGIAFAEIRRNPGQFIRGEGGNRYRRNALLAGSEMAFVGLVTIYFISMSLSTAGKQNTTMLKAAFIGFAAYLAACYLTRGFLLYRLISRATAKFGASKLALEFANWTPLVAVLLLTIFLSNYKFYCQIFPDRCVPPEDIQIADKLIQIPDIAQVTKIDVKLDESPKVKKQQIGGSKPKPKPASGGGGGGKQQPTPPSQGVPPVMALVQPIKPPDPEPPKIKNPSLVVAQNIYGDPKALPTLKGPIGDPNGVPAPPSSGPGKGDGIGRGAGQGVGGGDGGGLGNGSGGNTGGGNMGLGGGASVQPMSASLKPTILYKEKAKYTEEARQNKIQGTVTLNVVFNADGTISQFRVVRGLPDGLTEKAIEAARKIRFQPAVKNGQPVSVRGNLEFTFNLY